MQLKLGTAAICKWCDKPCQWNTAPEDSDFRAGVRTWLHSDTMKTRCTVKVTEFEYQDEPSHPRCSPIGFCPARVYNGHYETCNRRVKEENADLNLCGMHAPDERERLASIEARKLDTQLQIWAQNHLLELMEYLQEEYGITAKMAKERYGNSYDGNVIVKPERLIEVLDEMREDARKGRSRTKRS